VGGVPPSPTQEVPACKALINASAQRLVCTEDHQGWRTASPQPAAGKLARADRTVTQGETLSSSACSGKQAIEGITVSQGVLPAAGHGARSRQSHEALQLPAASHPLLQQDVGGGPTAQTVLGAILQADAALTKTC